MFIFWIFSSMRTNQCSTWIKPVISICIFQKLIQFGSIYKISLFLYRIFNKQNSKSSSILFLQQKLPFFIPTQLLEYIPLKIFAKGRFSRTLTFKQSEGQQETKKIYRLYYITRELWYFVRQAWTALASRAESIECKTKRIHFQFWHVWRLLFKHKLVHCFEECESLNLKTFVL